MLNEKGLNDLLLCGAIDGIGGDDAEKSSATYYVVKGNVDR